MAVSFPQSIDIRKLEIRKPKKTRNPKILYFCITMVTVGLFMISELYKKQTKLRHPPTGQATTVCAMKNDIHKVMEEQ